MIVRFLRTLLATAVGLYLLLVGVFFVFQRKLIYFPRPLTSAMAQRYADTQQLTAVRGPQGELLGWKTLGNAHTRNRMIVFHGNGSLALFDTGLIKAAPAGWQVVLAEYPGYGSVPGQPSEASIREAAGTLIQQLKQKPGSLFVAGQSLGTGVASWAAGAFTKDIAGLILITPFTRLSAVSAVHYPWLPAGLILKDRYESDVALSTYRGPVAFVVGGRDTIIPPQIGRKLAEGYAGPKLLVQQPGAAHNSIDFSPAEWTSIFEFITSHDTR